MMKYLISEQLAVRGLLSLLSMFVLFHLLVILSIIPLDMVWGGKVQDQSRILRLETLSVAINLLMLTVAAIKTGILKVKVPGIIIKTALWLMFGLFVMNTLGNLLSANELEKWLFMPVTLLLSLFCFRLAVRPAMRQREVC